MMEERESHKMNCAGGRFCKFQVATERQERSPGGDRESVRLPGAAERQEGH